MKRLAGAAITAAFLTVALPGGGPAGADPATAPTTASAAVQRMIDLSRESEQLNQQALGAQADFDAKLAAQRDAEAALATATDAVTAARDEVRKYQPVIDRTAIAAYQGARTNRLFSVLVSDSPQQLLDQMSTLDVVATQTSTQLQHYKKATDAATAAESAARTAADNARTAAEKADAVRGDLERKRADLQGAITQVIEAWGRLSAQDKSALAGSPFPPGFDRDSLLRGLVPGSGTSALAAGLTRVGDPYVWGATGPDQFDCSGLVQWAFKQVGKDVPRTSSAQASFGTPVAKDDLRPGDVVFFYPDISHVGIYAGNGLMLHASTFGVPVAVAPMGSTPYHSARRY
ncbi:NlpC/P60 family protein [Nocardia cyriacigeorgica]|uniref:NlpC/P60 family protein n=1 Tax=Nocardia cyriacigeorgica TaxID=135487 RepID=UPI001892D485|nr:NlpC/P60 family protein [Nocardia cyriacigeorgica]MBF6439221.1 C40 family peptidase [Nocardia cyriacigeorgica]MBF6455480.1 C40 family peptidase [Nocardia cyriacigeorgica]MBF6479628.1 C40 family peptidase [Nocardia cyriacigeorgica]MBF6553778.1 C40 family peptidase [Nocardia cyriacigeorgica]